MDFPVSDPPRVLPQIDPAQMGRMRLRDRIAQDAGDPLSMLGTVSDGASLALLSTICLTAALAEAEDFASFKAAYMARIGALSPGTDIAQASGDFLAGVADGQILLPPMAKGFDQVIAEVAARGVAVTTALAEHYAAQQPAD